MKVEDLPPNFLSVVVAATIGCRQELGRPLTAAEVDLIVGESFRRCSEPAAPTTKLQ